jgi:hypothetical protein
MLFFMFHYTQLYFMYIVTSFLCFTTQSCTSCTLSPLFNISLHKAAVHVHCHLVFIFHYTQLYFMYIVTSVLCFTRESCTSCRLSPLFCFNTHSCTSCTLSPLFLFFTTHSCTSCTLSPDNVHEVQLCVVKYKKEVTMYIKFSCL